MLTMNGLLQGCLDPVEVLHHHFDLNVLLGIGATHPVGIASGVVMIDVTVDLEIRDECLVKVGQEPIQLLSSRWSWHWVCHDVAWVILTTAH